MVKKNFPVIYNGRHIFLSLFLCLIIVVNFVVVIIVFSKISGKFSDCFKIASEIVLTLHKLRGNGHGRLVFLSFVL